MGKGRGMQGARGSLMMSATPWCPTAIPHPRRLLCWTFVINDGTREKNRMRLPPKKNGAPHCALLQVYPSFDTGSHQHTLKLVNQGVTTILWEVCSNIMGFVNVFLELCWFWKEPVGRTISTQKEISTRRSCMQTCLLVTLPPCNVSNPARIRSATHR